MHNLISESRHKSVWVLYFTVQFYLLFRHKVKSFECKWYIPISNVNVEAKPDDKTYSCKEDIDPLKKRIVSLKSELRKEVRKNTESFREVSKWLKKNILASKNCLCVFMAPVFTWNAELGCMIQNRVTPMFFKLLCYLWAVASIS